MGQRSWTGGVETQPFATHKLIQCHCEHITTFSVIKGKYTLIALLPSPWCWLTGGFPHKGPVTRKMFPIDDVIMKVLIPHVPVLRTHGTPINTCIYAMALVGAWQSAGIVFYIEINMPSFFHDDVIKWKHFPRHWTLCGEFTGEFPSQRPVTRNFDVFFDLCLIKHLRTQSRGWWFETPLRSLWRQCNWKAWYRFHDIAQW